jgi:hypothetical protein
MVVVLARLIQLFLYHCRGIWDAFDRWVFFDDWLRFGLWFGLGFGFGFGFGLRLRLSIFVLWKFESVFVCALVLVAQEFWAKIFDALAVAVAS